MKRVNDAWGKKKKKEKPQINDNYCLILTNKQCESDLFLFMETAGFYAVNQENQFSH